MSERHEKLDALLTIGPLLNDFCLEDVNICIFDTKELLATYPTQKIDFGIKKGDKIQPSWVIAEALKEERRVVVEEDESNFGIPYISAATPIFNEQGELIGGVTFNQPTDKKEELLEISKELLNFTESLNNEAEEIITKAEKMVNTGAELNNISQETETRVENTDNIVNIIKNISRQTKILGMNANIEAARVGEEGKGFGVVAQEVQELAAKSSNSISDIEETLNEVSEITKDLNNVAEKINKISTRQADIVNNIYAELQSLSALGNEVVQMAESFSKDQ